MEFNTSQKRIVGQLSILSGLLAAGCLVMGTVAVENNMEAFSDPVLTLGYAHNHVLAFWFNILDLFGYYLLLLPLALFLHQQLRAQSPWMHLITVCGVAYAVIGATGAAVLAAVWPELMQDHLSANATDQATITLLFKTITLAVTKGLWNILEMVFAAVWWIGLGILLRPTSKALAGLTMVLGIACVLDLAGNLVGIRMISEIGLNVYLLLAIVWPIVIGRRLVREARIAAFKSWKSAKRSPVFHGMTDPIN